MERSLEEEYPFLRLEEPNTVTNTRGRPRQVDEWGLPRATPMATPASTPTPAPVAPRTPPSANNTRRVSKTATRRQSQWEADSVEDIDGQPVAGTKKRKAASRAAASRKTSRTTASRAPESSTGMPPPSTAPPRLQETQCQLGDSYVLVGRRDEDVEKARKKARERKAVKPLKD